MLQARKDCDEVNYNKYSKSALLQRERKNEREREIKSQQTFIITTKCSVIEDKVG